VHSARVPFLLAETQDASSSRIKDEWKEKQLDEIVKQDCEALHLQAPAYVTLSVSLFLSVSRTIYPQRSCVMRTACAPTNSPLFMIWVYGSRVDAAEVHADLSR